MQAIRFFHNNINSGRHNRAVPGESTAEIARNFSSFFDPCNLHVRCGFLHLKNVIVKKPSKSVSWYDLSVSYKSKHTPGTDFVYPFGQAQP
jgi:hypothetical protein